MTRVGWLTPVVLGVLGFQDCRVRLVDTVYADGVLLQLETCFGYTT